MKNPMENNKNEYVPKSYIEKQEYFTPEQEKFLNDEVREMNEDALLEDDYTKIYSNFTPRYIRCK